MFVQGDEMNKQMHRLFVKEVIARKTDENGNSFVSAQWKEVPSVDIGSINKPNKDILEFAFIPIEDDSTKLSSDDIFKRFLR